MALFTSDTVHAASLHNLLHHELKDLYDAEQRILEHLPKMIEAADNAELTNALEEHRRETETQVTRLEDCFEALQLKAERVECDGMRGILKEGEHVVKGDMDPAVKDDAIIGAAKRVEHYEMAAYEAACEHAKTLGLDDVAERLEATMKEEKAAAEKLRSIGKHIHARKGETMATPR